MKKLHSFAFYALVTPAITLGSGTLLAAQSSSDSGAMQGQSVSQDADREMQSSQTGQDSMKSDTKSAQTEQKMGDQSGMQNKSYMDSPPTNGMAASDLIGTDLKTSGDESLGEIGDLIIDQDGKVAAVVVNIGGFLGMGEKNVAITWDNIKMSDNPDNRDLRVDMTRDELQSAPTYEQQDD